MLYPYTVSAANAVTLVDHFSLDDNENAVKTSESLCDFHPRILPTNTQIYNCAIAVYVIYNEIFRERPDLETLKGRLSGQFSRE